MGNVNIEGILYNSSNEAIDTIRASYQGMGVFRHIPTEGKAYVVVSHKKKKRRFDLPEALSDGYVMTLDNYNKDSLYVQIQASSHDMDTSLGLSIMCRGKVSIFRCVEVVDGHIPLKLPKSEMKAGVNQITLFDKEGKVISERMFFVSPDSIEGISLLSSEKQLKPFEQILLSFQSLHLSSFSLSVRDHAGEMAGWDHNIQTDLLLSSDIKGYIENPQFYFRGDDIKQRVSLDLLMMVQGWRRYVWQQMSTPSIKKQKHEVEKGILLKGQIQSAISDYIEKDSIDLMMNLLVEDKIYKTKINFNEEGKFNLLLDDFQGNVPALIYIKSKTQGDSIRSGVGDISYKILLDRVFSPKLRPYSIFNTEIRHSKRFLTNEENVLDQKIDLTQIQVLPEVTIGGYDKFEPRQRYDVEKEKSDLLDQGFRHPKTVWDYFMWKKIPISKKERRKNNSASYHYSQMVNNMSNLSTNKFDNSQHADYERYYSVYGEEVLLLYGATGKWEDKIIFGGIVNVSLDEVKIIKIYDDKYAYRNIKMKRLAPKEIDGRRITIVVEPYKKDDVLNIQDQTNIRSTKIEGYSVMKEFYCPDYGKYPPIPGDVDYRRTLYWNPNVKTDEQGKASISFYNNSTCRKITVSAEGLSEDGVPIVYQKD